MSNQEALEEFKRDLMDLLRKHNAELSIEEIPNRMPEIFVELNAVWKGDVLIRGFSESSLGTGVIP